MGLRAQLSRAPGMGKPYEGPAPDTQQVILVADDDRLIVATISAALRSAGFRVIEAFDCAGALSACITEHPSLALIDYKMPDSNGVQLARQIAERTDAAVIFLSAYGDESIVREAVNAGAMSYLVKPFDPVQVIPVVRAALQRAKELRELQTEADRLSLAVQSGKQIGIATGLVMATLHVSQREAFERLRRHARAIRTRVEDVASTLLRGADQAGELYEALIPVRTVRKPSDEESGDR